MQAANDRIGTDRIRFSVAMARIGMWVVESGERRIGDTGSKLTHEQEQKLKDAFG
jgi:hypothetical protein